MKNLLNQLTFLFIIFTLAGFTTNVSSNPNIIYIMADDLGYGDLSCYGQKIIQTPNIDQLAEEGIKFTQHYSGTSVCAPSRSVLMTGLHVGHNPIRGNMQYEPHGQKPLPDSTITVAEALKTAGYTTGMIGKWGLGIEGSEGDPNVQGWDYFFGYTDQVLAHNYYPEYLVKNGEHVKLKNEVKYLDSTKWHGGYGSYSTKKVEYSNDLFTDDALRFIKENAEQPFFLYLPYTIPHNNGEAPLGERQEVPDLERFEYKDWPKETKGYAAMIERLDDYVGAITKLVDSLGLGNNTLIVFTSDNGPLQEHKHGFTAFFDSNGKLKGGKRDLYEGAIRVPFVARWTGKIAPGRITDHQSVFYDFLPTACDIAGIDVPVETDGISYLPELLGEEQAKHEFLYWEFLEGGKLQAIRKGNFKGLRLNVFENPDAPIKLYDLSNDISEENNIADQHPEIVQEMQSVMDHEHVYDSNWPLFETEVKK